MFYAITTYQVNPAKGSAFEEAIVKVVEYYKAQPGVNVVKLVKRTHILADEQDVLAGEPPMRIARPISGFCYALFVEVDTVDIHTHIAKTAAKEYGAIIDACLITDAECILGEELGI